MKSIELELYNTKKLSHEELINTVGGASFAYRVGQFLRYVALGGGIYAMIDLSKNEAINSVN